MTREEAIDEMLRVASETIGRPLTEVEQHSDTGPRITMQYVEGLNDMRSDYQLDDGSWVCVQFYGGPSNVAKAWIE